MEFTLELINEASFQFIGPAPTPFAEPGELVLDHVSVGLLCVCFSLSFLLLLLLLLLVHKRNIIIVKISSVNMQSVLA